MVRPWGGFPGNRKPPLGPALTHTPHNSTENSTSRLRICIQKTSHANAASCCFRSAVTAWNATGVEHPIREGKRVEHNVYRLYHLLESRPLAWNCPVDAEGDSTTVLMGTLCGGERDLCMILGRKTGRVHAWQALKRRSHDRGLDDFRPFCHRLFVCVCGSFGYVVDVVHGKMRRGVLFIGTLMMKEENQIDHEREKRRKKRRYTSS